MKKIIIAIFIVVVAIIIGFVLLQKSGKLVTNKNFAPTERNKASVAVNISVAGFSIGTVTVAKGAKIELNNSTSSDIEITSEKSSFRISAGKSYPLTFSNSGQYKYVDKTNNQVLLIIVQ